jgi:hypothetical protein
MRYSLDSKPDPAHDETLDCFCCGNRADAMWAGQKGTVEVCRTCALTVLPALIADSVFVGMGEKYAAVRFEEALAKAHTAYWKAVASRLSAEIRAMKTEAPEPTA